MNYCNAASVPARLGWIVLVIISLVSFSPLRGAAEPPAANSKRFLFIIDTSAGMKPFEKAVSETLFDLVYSGVRGHMTNGDTYGIWLVNEQNNTSFQMETWKQKWAVEIAAKAAKHVKDHDFKGKCRLSAAIADAAAIIRNVEDLTVVLISNGETPLHGTPFDDIMNLRFRELAPHMKRVKATLNTTLVAQEGRIVAWAANSPEFLIEIPRVAPRPPRAKLAASTNATNAVVSSALPASGPPKPRVAANPIIITRDSVAEEKRAWQAMSTTTAVPEPLVVVTNLTEKTVPSLTRTNELVATNALVSAPSNTIALALPSPTNASPAPSNAASISTVQNSVTVPREALLIPVSAADRKSEAPWGPILWAGVGAAVAVACLLGGFLLARGRRDEPSLISQSLASERVRAT